jgi:hypothetical protein
VSDSELSPGTWRKSTASGTGNCVEVSFLGGSILMRHSRSPHGPVLSFSRPEWDAFLTGVREGEFDNDTPLPRANRDGRDHLARLGDFTAPHARLGLSDGGVASAAVGAVGSVAAARIAE